MLVTVTAADIAEGVPKCCTLCPVALALFRATGVAWWVLPTMARPLIGPTDHGAYTDLPDPVPRFVWQFDDAANFETPEPFSFEFDWEPQESTA